MGDEAFKTKKNEPTHISPHCLELAVCTAILGLNFLRSPADVTLNDAECASLTAWRLEEDKRAGAEILFV